MYDHNNLYCPLDSITLTGIFIWKLRHFQKDNTIKMGTLHPLPHKQQPNTPPVPCPEHIEENYDALYI